MRTLFLTDNKAKRWSWRIVLVCGLVVAIMVGVYSVIGELVGSREPALMLLSVVLFGVFAALAYRRFQVWRLQSTVRDLKDSALW
jgi:uncharacterized membrane-anchored protein